MWPCRRQWGKRIISCDDALENPRLALNWKVVPESAILEAALQFCGRREAAKPTFGVADDIGSHCSRERLLFVPRMEDITLLARLVHSREFRQLPHYQGLTFQFDAQ